jgi:dTDP-4-dehydrorhamnose 3,5-epimerase-like enzyme
MNRFESSPTALAGVYVLEREPVGDNRGHLERMFCAQGLVFGIIKRVVGWLQMSMLGMRPRAKGVL